MFSFPISLVSKQLDASRATNKLAPSPSSRLLHLPCLAMRRKYSRADATLTSLSHSISQNFSSLLNAGQHLGLDLSGSCGLWNDVNRQTAKQQSGREPPAGGPTRPATSRCAQGNRVAWTSSGCLELSRCPFGLTLPHANEGQCEVRVWIACI